MFLIVEIFRVLKRWLSVVGKLERITETVKLFFIRPIQPWSGRLLYLPACCNYVCNGIHSLRSSVVDFSRLTDVPYPLDTGVIKIISICQIDR